VNAEIVGVGTELLLGQIPNTNAQWISERLAEIGVGVHHHQAVGDNVPRIVDAIRLARSRADVVILTGGLGPTQDDVTRESISEALDRPLERHAELETMLREKFAGFGREMPESNLRQAEVPTGARAILPERGTAPGLVLEDGDTRVYAVPGVPAEMREICTAPSFPSSSGSEGRRSSSRESCDARGSASRRSRSSSTTCSRGARTRRLRSSPRRER
jgi:nicotinamide-nucleotide amidase